MSFLIFQKFKMRVGIGLLLFLLGIASLAPWLAPVSPSHIQPGRRFLHSGEVSFLKQADGTQKKIYHYFGTDGLGRDLYGRVLYGLRISFLIGALVAGISSLFGILFGLLTGFFHQCDSFFLCILDGIVSIPAILWASLFVTLWGPGILVVIFALILSEIPGTVRLVRSETLVLRKALYVDSALLLGTGRIAILFRHLLPSILPLVFVQATFLFLSAILLEVLFSFLGLGLPERYSSLGNVLAGIREKVHYPFLYPLPFLFLFLFSLHWIGEAVHESVFKKFSRRAF